MLKKRIVYIDKAKNRREFSAEYEHCACPDTLAKGIKEKESLSLVEPGIISKIINYFSSEEKSAVYQFEIICAHCEKLLVKVNG